MDELLAEIDNHNVVKGDSRSLTRYATTITVFVRDMEDNGCSVQEASEAPFLMSKLLSKLHPRDNCEFGREMQRGKKEENISNLVDWLHREVSLRSRGRKENDGDSNTTKGGFRHKSANNFGEVVDDDTCPMNCTTKHLLSACPVYHNLSVSQRWDTVKNHKRCRKCLRGSHHTRDCKKPDGQTCDKCPKNHHRSLHAERADPSPPKKSAESSQSKLNPQAQPFSTGENLTNSENRSVQGTDKQAATPVSATGMCPVQKVKVKDADGEPVEILAMLDTGSNTSLLSKRVAKKLGLTGTQTQLTMNLAGGKKRSELSEVLEVTAVSPTDEDVQKTFQVHTVQTPCSSAKTLSHKAIELYPHLKSLSEKLHISGGTVDLLIGTDFVDAFVDVHTACGEPGDPVAKKNCFGWYVLGPVESAETPHVQSVTVNRVSAVVEDVHKLVQQDSLGVRLTELCTCSDSVLKENKFVKALNESTTLVDGRIEVRMPWKEHGPPKQSNYDIALKRMYSAEKSFKKKECFEVVDEEVQKLVDQEFVIKVPPEEIDHSQPEWYLPLQAVFTPDKSTKVRLVFDSSSKGHDGLSLNYHLEKGPNYINCLPNVVMAWRWDEVAYSGDVRKMFNQVMVHPSDQVYHRFLWRRDPNDPPVVYQWLRLNFGDKPAPDIASNAVNFLAKDSQAELPEAAKELLEHTYVDDIGGSKPTVDEAVQVTTGIDKILGKGQFQIKVWHSNYKEVDESDGEQTTDLLGHKWDKLKDSFSLKKDTISSFPQDLTKRACLALLAQLWDPIGLIAPDQLKDWMSGPSFLKLPESDWPKFEEESMEPPNEVTKKEMKSTKKQGVVSKDSEVVRECHATTQEESGVNPILAHLLDTCSTFKKVRRVLAYVFRFVQATRGKDTSKGSLSVQELKDSETQLLKWCQLQLDESKFDKKLIAKPDQDGVVRVHGRLEDIRSLPSDLRNPVILPRKHQLVLLLLRHLHEKRGHCGYKSLIHEARRKYWILGIRDMARALVNGCVVCRKLRKKPLEQLMGQLPTLRAAVGFPPFSSTAMDMFGPVHIRLNRRTLQEAQVVIFTCTTTRAIHLELVTDKSSDTFLMAFRRFACLRGHPNTCYSDCGTNFVGAQDYLKEVMRNWDIPKIQSILSEEFTCNFQWQWNIPHASHQNGVVETLIKSVRQALNCVCKNQTFTEEQWRTFLAEVTYMVNGRPLYPSSDEIWEAPPITPNEILLSQHNSPPQPEQEARVNPRHLVRSVQSRVYEFWTSWMKYFAPNLLPRNKWYRARENLQIGDLVLELDANHKRGKWKMAVIVRTYPGQDGLVRKVRIKTKDGEFDRPIHKLCLIATNQELSGQ